MILRGLATVLLLALLLLDAMLSTTSIGRRGTETEIRTAVATGLTLGSTLTPFELRDLEGRVVRSEALRGERVLLAFGRSLDWCPYSKQRLFGLREALADEPGLRIVWVLSTIQMSDRTRSFIEELGLADGILFLTDPRSRLIRDLGLLEENPDPIEKGVPHPTTLLLDRAGRIRLVDIRDDAHVWLDPRTIEQALDRMG